MNFDIATRNIAGSNRMETVMSLSLSSVDQVYLLISWTEINTLIIEINDRKHTLSQDLRLRTIFYMPVDKVTSTLTRFSNR